MGKRLVERISVLLQPVYTLLCNFSWRGGSQSVFKIIITVCRTICWVDEGDEHFSSKKQWMMMKSELEHHLIWFYICAKKKILLLYADILLELLVSYWSCLHSIHTGLQNLLSTLHILINLQNFCFSFFLKEIFKKKKDLKVIHRLQKGPWKSSVFVKFYLTMRLIWQLTELWMVWMKH